MFIETKLAIQEKIHLFLAGRSQYIVAVENDWWKQRFFTPLTRIYFSVACLFMTGLNDIFH